MQHHPFCTYVLKFWGEFRNFCSNGRCMGNFRSSTEKTPILWIWLRKRLFCKICWKNTIPQIVCQKNVFKLNKMLCFLRKKKCPFAAVCDFPTIILYISERLMCLQLRMFVHFFFNPLVCVLQSVSLSLTLLFVFVSLSVYLLWQARRTSGVNFVWFRASSGFMSVTHCLYGERDGAD